MQKANARARKRDAGLDDSTGEELDDSTGSLKRGEHENHLDDAHLLEREVDAIFCALDLDNSADITPAEFLWCVAQLKWYLVSRARFEVDSALAFSFARALFSGVSWVVLLVECVVVLERNAFLHTMRAMPCCAHIKHLTLR